MSYIIGFLSAVIYVLMIIIIVPFSIIEFVLIAPLYLVHLLFEFIGEFFD